MAKRDKKQRPAKMTRKYQSRVERERRQIRYILTGVGVVVAIIVLLLAAGLYKTQVADPAATRRAKDELKEIPAVTVNGTMVSVADWQSRVRYERQLRINQIAQIDQQLSFFDPASEFGQQLIEQGQAQIQEIRNLLDLGDGIAADVLDQMVEEQLIRQEAAQRGIAVTPDELQEFIEVNLFAYPYPPTPEPVPTLPPPTLAPTATVTPEPTLAPTPTSTPRSLEDFESDYEQYTEQVLEITQMSEQVWRSMIEGELYREKLLEVFGAEVETEVQQVQGRYIVTQDQETAEALLARLEAGETFEALEQEIEADESEEPKARTGRFDWSPLGVIQQRFGEEFAAIVFNTSAGQYANQVISGTTGDQFYLVYVEGNETRELADYLIDQQRSDLFQSWLDEQKLGDGIVYGDWRLYIPREPSIQ
jgi:parvulin-like peptidyl-prolyl isomerase